ncbi:EPIDERMAL PATTERNING FACTOR-like protein 3 isoform X2 [Corylus avellana]|uniref:EPIDERMAL PATTERNING FACTOR-like protein 3 isoform X2 n=1 Tax=Corylus avellana TaxID=13451 RepID=UPI00286AA9C1|nr:EPIDERMAL PATTERNING FACTOR-like protein 3 isoform X2 [Corylus avellana]
MKGRFCCCFIIALQIVSWASATSRPFPPNDSLGAHQPGQSSESLTVALNTEEGLKRVREKTNREAMQKGVSKIGSSPPNCEHKCYGCVPCEAIQVPTTSMHSHLGIQYANYEPEGWKCKCGPSFYSP